MYYDMVFVFLSLRPPPRSTLTDPLVPYPTRFQSAIAEAYALFDHPYKQDILFKDLEEKLAAKSVGDLPKRLDGHRHARAYFGIIRLEMGGAAVNGDEQEEFIRADRKSTRLNSSH